MFHDGSLYDEEKELLFLSGNQRRHSTYENDSVELQVSIRVLSYSPHDIHSTAACCTIYIGNLDLLSKLQVQDGQLCLLKSEDLRNSSTDLRREHPVMLTFLSTNNLQSFLSDSAETLSKNDSTCEIYVPPCIAAAVGFHECLPNSKLFYLSPLQFCDGSQVHSSTQLTTATSATLREMAPPPSDNLADLNSILLNKGNKYALQQARLETCRVKIVQKLQNYFSMPLVGHKSLHLMCEHSLIAIDDDTAPFVRFFKIEDFQLSSFTVDEKRFNTESRCFVISPDTQLVLLPQEQIITQSQSNHRLPNADKALRFYHSIMRVGSLPTQLSTVHSHPSLHKVVDALLHNQIHSNMRKLHSFENSTLAIVGHEDNHLKSCLDTAAVIVGMRIIHIRGLAAFGYRAQSILADKTSLQSITGSTRDKLIGLVAAIDCARRSAPCILHLSLDGEVLSSENKEEERENQIRLLLCLQEELKQSNWALSQYSNIEAVPSVQVVLSSSKPIKDCVLCSNIIHDVVEINPPDINYARVLWSDDRSFDALYLEYLQGRCAKEILYIKYVLGDRFHNSSLQELTQNTINICRTIEDKMIGAFHDKGSNRGLCIVPDVRWEDVGGLEHVRKEIFDAIELPLKYPDLFINQKRRGILLHGPPGSGKTLVAKAVATEYDLPFISVKGPELLGSFVGESEANIRNIFSLAREAAIMSKGKNGAILFFDEIDSLAPRRGQKHDGGGIMDRVTVTFLGELDIARGDSTAYIYVICATNRPDLLDPSLLRPGRIDKILYLGPPDSREDRVRILAALCRRFTFEKHENSYKMAQDIIDCIPPKLSGADLASISSAAIMKSMERLCARAELELSQKSSDLDNAGLGIEDILTSWNISELIPLVTRDDFISASLNISPSIHQDDLKTYETLKNSFH